MATRWIAGVVAAAAVMGTVAVAACSDDGTHPRQGAEIAFEIVVDEAACGLEDSLRLAVRDEATWARLWDEIYRPVEPTPHRLEVDFTKDMLIAVAMGTRRSGGFDITVERIAVEDGQLMVTVRSSRPPPDAVVGMALTQPLQIVRVERTDQEVVFLDAEASEDHRR